MEHSYRQEPLTRWMH